MAIKAKSADTNFSDRPVAKHVRHNTSLEKSITKERQTTTARKSRARKPEPYDGNYIGPRIDQHAKAADQPDPNSFPHKVYDDIAAPLPSAYIEKALADAKTVARAKVRGAASPAKAPGVEAVVISPPNTQRAVATIVGIAPYVQHKFSQKALNMMTETQMAGSRSKKGTKREPRDFEADYEGAKHISEAGWIGIPATSIRNAMIDACRLCGFQMTRAKLSVFVEEDGFDADDGTPLVRIIGDPVVHKGYARNQTGVADIRHRPMWRNWSADVKLRWDGDQFSISDIMNLLLRAGLQVGIGEGRPSSPNSFGLNWGLFEIARPE